MGAVEARGPGEAGGKVIPFRLRPSGGPAADLGDLRFRTLVGEEGASAAMSAKAGRSSMPARWSNAG
jgi:hypothetical protein